MDYMTLEKAGEKWGVPPQRINYYCVTGCIPSAVKMVTIWLTPKTAERPTDRRTKKRKVVTEQYSEIGAFWVWF